jgi:hypothetical protein
MRKGSGFLKQGWTVHRTSPALTHPLPGSYNTGPGLGALGTETFVIWVGTPQADEVIIDAFGRTHTETHTGQTAIGNPAIVGFNGHVYYAWTGTDGAHTINVAQFQ